MKRIGSVTEKLRGFAAQFGIAREEVASLGLPEAQLLRLPKSVMAASIGINVLGLALPISVLQVYDRIIPRNSIETLTALLGGLVLVVIVDSVLRIARGYLSAWAAARFTQAAVLDAYTRIIHAPDQIQEQPARQMQKFLAVQRLGDFFGGRSRLLLMDMPFVPAFLLVMALIGGSVVLVALAVLVIFALATLHMGRRLKAAQEERDRHDAKVHDFIADVLSGVTTVKGHAMESLMLRRFERLQRHGAEIDFDTIQTSIRSDAKVTALGNVTMVALVTYGALLAVFDHMTIGTLSACTLLSGRVIQPILGAASLWNEVQKMRMGLRDIAEVFALPVPQRRGKPVVEDAPALAITDLSMQGTMTPALVHWTIDLPPGGMVALTGPDEAAKLLLDVVTGTREADSGRVSVNGRSPDQYRHTRPGACSFASRYPVFFRGTILENMTLFGHGPGVEAVRWAASLVGVDKEIAQLPKGYDTLLGEGVSEVLPAGMLKRISIARALATGPGLLVLDEPQAFLDNASDKALLACLQNLKGYVTIVLSSSRPSYLAIADQAFECRDGALLPWSSAPAAAPRMTALVQAAGGAA